jgi:phosphomethylpyrimidine synthase
MRITDDVRRLAEAEGVAPEQAAAAGMAAKAAEFRAGGGSLYS